MIWKTLLLSLIFAQVAFSQRTVTVSSNGVLAHPSAEVFRQSNDIARASALVATNEAIRIAMASNSVDDRAYAASLTDPNAVTNIIGTGMTVSRTNKTFYLRATPSTNTAASVDADLQDHKTNATAHADQFSAKQATGDYATVSMLEGATNSLAPDDLAWTNKLDASATNGFIKLSEVPPDNLAWQSNAVDAIARATNTAQDIVIGGKADTNDVRFSDARAPLAHQQPLSTITNAGNLAYSNSLTAVDVGAATSAQGALADTAVQPAALGGYIATNSVGRFGVVSVNQNVIIVSGAGVSFVNGTYTKSGDYYQHSEGWMIYKSSGIDDDTNYPTYTIRSLIANPLTYYYTNSSAVSPVGTYYVGADGTGPAPAVDYLQTTNWIGDAAKVNLLTGSGASLTLLDLNPSLTNPIAKALSAVLTNDAHYLASLTNTLPATNALGYIVVSNGVTYIGTGIVAGVTGAITNQQSGVTLGLVSNTAVSVFTTNLTVQGSTTLNKATVINGSANEVQLRVRGSSTGTQASNIFEVVDNTPTTRFAVDPKGGIKTVPTDGANSIVIYNSTPPAAGKIGSGSVWIQDAVGAGLTTAGNGNDVIIGRYAGSAKTTSSSDTSVGYAANGGEWGNTSGGFNSGFGALAGFWWRGAENTFIGANAGCEGSTSGAGDGNVAIGFKAFGFAGGTGPSSKNIAIGPYSLRYNFKSINNIAIGYQAGDAAGGQYTETGIHTGCVFIGTSAGRYQTNTSYVLVMDQIARSSKIDESTNSMLYGNFASTRANQSLAINANLSTINLNVEGNITNNGMVNINTAYFPVYTNVVATLTNYTINPANGSEQCIKSTTQNVYITSSALTVNKAGLIGLYVDPFTNSVSWDTNVFNSSSWPVIGTNGADVVLRKTWGSTMWTVNGPVPAVSLNITNDFGGVTNVYVFTGGMLSTNWVVP